MTQHKYVSTAEIAAHFNVSPATISMMVRTGEIPAGSFVRLGRVYRFDLERIEAELLSKQAGDDPQLSFDFDQPTAEDSATNEGDYT